MCSTSCTCGRETHDERVMHISRKRYYCISNGHHTCAFYPPSVQFGPVAVVSFLLPPPLHLHPPPPPPLLSRGLAFGFACGISSSKSGSGCQVLGGWFDTDWWCTPANHDQEYCSDKDKNRSSGGSRCSSNNSIGINSNSNDDKRPIRTSSKSQDGSKEGSGPGGSGRGSKNLVKSGHEVGAGRTPGIKESPVEHDPVDPWMRGMRRMVDGNAPLVRIFRQELQLCVVQTLI